MGESRRKKDKRAPIKRTDQLARIPVTTDRSVATKQRAFCKSIVTKMLADETSLSFSKPVGELWDISILDDYFDRIKTPMDLGTVRKRLANGYNQPDSEIFDPNPFREELRLVFLNALDYNPKGSDLAKLASRFLTFIDIELSKLPLPSSPEVPDEKEKDLAVEQVTPKPSDLPEKKDSPEGNGADDKPSAEDDAKPPEEEDDDADNSPEENGETVDDDIDKNDADENGDPMEEDTQAKDEQDAVDEEREKLEQQLKDLTKACNRSNAAIAEIELEKNAPLSHEENTRLRDEVEALPWETSQKVVEILRKHVDDALQATDENDPEFVTLELSTVETRLLRQIEELIRPDPRVVKEKEAIESTQKEIENVKRKLKRLHESSSNSKRKRSKKSR